MHNNFVQPYWTHKWLRTILEKTTTKMRFKGAAYILEYATSTLQSDKKKYFCIQFSNWMRYQISETISIESLERDSKTKENKQANKKVKFNDMMQISFFQIDRQILGSMIDIY